ncbi:hypothetical protein AMS62_21110 [Bacillus sp. FJAT-18019]|nr:hypothetical protein AMS62_21110 [Bacillus sp. FJAT-18019]
MIKNTKVLTCLRKFVFPISMFLLILIVVSYKWYTHPKHIVQNIDGVEFSLGEDHNQDSAPVKIEIDGMLQRTWKGHQQFEGSIQVISDTETQANAGKHTKVIFNLSGGGVLIYDDFVDGTLKLESYGLIFMKDNFSSVAIAKYTPENGQTKSWYAHNGLMIAGPTSNREDGISLSNKLLADFLKDNPLE